MGDLLYHAYSRSLPKPCPFSVFIVWFFMNLVLFYWLYSFTVLSYMPFLVTFETFSHFLFFLLQLAFLCHMSVLVVVEAFWLPILEILVRLSNVHGLSSSSIGYSYACLVIILSLCGLVSLSYWYNCHLPLLECLWCYLIIHCLMFFFNRNIVCKSSISAFIASASNFIMKLAVFCFPCLKNSTFHLASAVFILISFTKSS